MSDLCPTFYFSDSSVYVASSKTSLVSEEQCKDFSVLLTDSDNNYIFDDSCCYIKEDSIQVFGYMPPPSSLYLSLEFYSLFFVVLGSFCSYLLTKYLWGYS